MSERDTSKDFTHRRPEELWWFQWCPRCGGTNTEIETTADDETIALGDTCVTCLDCEYEYCND